MPNMSVASFCSVAGSGVCMALSGSSASSSGSARMGSMAFLDEDRFSMRTSAVGDCPSTNLSLLRTGTPNSEQKAGDGVLSLQQLKKN